MKMKVEHMFTPFGMLSLIIMACLDVIQPKAVSETDEQDLAQLMAKADAETKRALSMKAYSVGVVPPAAAAGGIEAGTISPQPGCALF